MLTEVGKPLRNFYCPGVGAAPFLYRAQNFLFRGKIGGSAGHVVCDGVLHVSILYAHAGLIECFWPENLRPGFHTGQLRVCGTVAALHIRPLFPQLLMHGECFP